MREIDFEVCAETIQACVAARDGGAGRIELCSSLSEGGLTPSHGLVSAVVEISRLPVHVLVRPRGGDFCYSEDEIRVIMKDIHHAKMLGAAGVVLGVLRPDRTIDTEATRRLVDAARPVEVTFHRAIDCTPAIEPALEDAIAIGCDRVLTSGGKKNVLAGAATLARLVAQANDRIEVAVGGGLRLGNAARIVRITGSRHFHGSLQAGRKSAQGERRAIDAEAVGAMIERLRRA